RVPRQGDGGEHEGASTEIDVGQREATRPEKHDAHDEHGESDTDQSLGEQRERCARIEHEEPGGATVVAHRVPHESVERKREAEAEPTATARGGPTAPSALLSRPEPSGAAGSPVVAPATAATRT